jgi:hypothetical protein
LILFDLLIVLNLFSFKLLSEFIDFLLFLVENLILLLLARLSVLFFEVLINFLNVLVVLVDHLFNLEDFFVHLFDLSIILLDTILKSLSGFWKWEVHLIGLKLEILLLFHKGGPLLLEMLSSLLQGIRSELTLRLGKSHVDLLKLVSRVGDFLVEHETCPI